MRNVKSIVMEDYQIHMIVDEDGQLNIYVESLDDSPVIEIETGQDTDNQVAHRFTTEKIEEKYLLDTE